MIEKTKSTLKILSILFLIGIPLFPQSGWVFQNSNTTNDLNDIFFINADTGWCCGDGSILLKTINGGKNWDAIHISDKEFSLGLIHYFNYDTILIPGKHTGAHTNEGSFILISVDGGNSWTTKNTTRGGEETFFINSKTGWDVNQSDKVYKTIDGGEIWIEYSNCIVAMHILFINNTVGFSCLNGISKTINGGKTWVKKQNDLPNGDFHGIFFINDSIGWVTGCSVYKTIDGGETWKYKHKFGDYSNPPYSSNNMPVTCYFVDKNNGWAAGMNGTIYKTIDGGNSWILQDSGTTNMLSSIFFIDEDIGYAVGSNGMILKTTNGGNVTSIKENINSIDLSFIDRLLQNYPNPFNPSTMIKYHLKKSSNIMLKIYNLNGQEIETLVNEFQAAGEHEITWTAEGLPNGIYFYRLQAGEYIETKKLILQK